MTNTAYRGVLLLAFAIGCAACDGRPPTGPIPLPPVPRTTPTVTAISPSMGSTVRPTPVMISGTGFFVGATVTIDAVAVNVTVVNSTTITAIAPAHASGPADVVVTNPGGSVGMLTAGFTYSFDVPFTLTPSTNAVDAGGQISVSWTAPAARARDWIAVFRVGEGFDDDHWYGVTNGETSGTLTLTAPTRPGQYEFRYLLDDGFADVARSSPFTVRSVPLEDPDPRSQSLSSKKPQRLRVDRVVSRPIEGQPEAHSPPLIPARMVRLDRHGERFVQGDACRPFRARFSLSRQEACHAFQESSWTWRWVPGFASDRQTLRSASFDHVCNWRLMGDVRVL